MKNKQFVWLLDTKIKSTFAPDGIRHTAEVCHFADNGDLMIFKASVLETGMEKIVMVFVRSRNQGWQPLLSDRSRAQLPYVWHLAEIVIGKYMAEYNAMAVKEWAK